MKIKYYDEGDQCPKCKKGMLINTQCRDTGTCFVVCQDCNYDATDDEKGI